MYKEMIFDKLVSIGMDPSLVGMHSLVELLEVLPDRPGGLCTACHTVEKKLGYNSGVVERNIRHAVESFYDNVAEPPAMLRASATNGRLSVGQFVYRLRAYLIHDMGYLGNGTWWAITNHPLIEGDYVVRKYLKNANYAVFTGTYAECIKFIEDGGYANAV